MAIRYACAPLSKNTIISTRLIFSMYIQDRKGHSRPSVDIHTPPNTKNDGEGEGPSQ